MMGGKRWNHDGDKLTSRDGLSQNPSATFDVDKMPYGKGQPCLPAAGDHAVCGV